MNTTAAPAPSRRPWVLVLQPYFPPAQQGGGSVRALQALTATLKDEFDFTVLARDHDLRSPTPYAAPQPVRRRAPPASTRLPGARQRRPEAAASRRWLSPSTSST